MYIYAKICTKCNTKKPLTEFNKDSSKKDGLRSSCKSCINLHYTQNKERIINNHKKYYQDNKESFKEYNKKYRQDNKESIKKYYQDNKKSQDDRNKRYASERRKSDPLFRLAHNIRSLVYASMKNLEFKKNTKTHEILGCSYDEFKIHIENQFMEGMTWDNRSEWHLDHITPISWGNTEEEIIALNHYTNFQPLWAVDNMKKGNRFSG